ncbi:hypothetical protein GCM10010269_48260 [Streptomyces humidus]|uniref:Secreted protein n=1 Tax=Streptomyces humidus TaxID=52259 RepID=A0A918G039_9ACTN|nr:hypothetical protein [Streptomyces humidus]GGS03676.1 hypothetical protein GCM10010269_48260 [Streptomyces humidus]
MGRTAHFLSALAVAGAVLVAVGPAASADPAAQVSPGSVAPGGSVSVSVSCGPLAAPAPESLEATSPAFAEGTVKLSKVPGDEAQDGTAYRGTARIAPAADLEAEPGAAGADAAGTDAAGADAAGVDTVGADAAWTVDGTCPAEPGAQGKPWSAALKVAHDRTQPCVTPTADASCGTGRPCPQAPGASQPHSDACPTTRPCARPEPQQHGTASEEASCAPATVDHGVRAGEGGAFTDSVPALVAGGLLIAGALGAAVHRLRRRAPAGDA